jgi:predicted dithiol-disulfide oxidoreductase (DUF899 family)
MIEQNLKIALKHSKVSVATPTRGPKQRISAFKCTRRWSFNLDVNFTGSIKANRSSTFTAAISTSDCKKNYLKNTRTTLYSKHTRYSLYLVFLASIGVFHCFSEKKPSGVYKIIDIKYINLF